MPFDVLMFNGGMKINSWKTSKENWKATILCNQLLSESKPFTRKKLACTQIEWSGNYGYVIQETVQFFIKIYCLFN